MTSEDKLHWVDGIAQGLIHCAARHAPGTLSERLEEEWLADLRERRGFSRLRFAIGCCWATNMIAREFGVAAVAAAVAPLEHGYLAGPVLDDSAVFSRRTLTFLLVASLHAAVFFGIAMGFHQRFVKVKPTEFVARQIDVRAPIDVPKPPSPNLLKPIIDTVPRNDFPPIQPELPTDSVQRVIDEPQDQTLPLSIAAPTSSRVKRVEGAPGTGFPSTDDYYPSAAIFNQEQGAATIRACIDPRGRLTSEPAIVESSGSTRLDLGALKLAKAGSGHYRATTEDGKPVDSCYRFRIRFQLRN
jgi:hypothetical protein